MSTAPFSLLQGGRISLTLINSYCCIDCSDVLTPISRVSISYFGNYGLRAANLEQRIHLAYPTNTKYYGGVPVTPAIWAPITTVPELQNTETTASSSLRICKKVLLSSGIVDKHKDGNFLGTGPLGP